MARFFRGGLTISEMMKMTYREILFWYDIYELQVTEEEVKEDLCFDKKTGKRKKVSEKAIVTERDRRIKERKDKLNGGHE